MFNPKAQFHGSMDPAGALRPKAHSEGIEGVEGPKTLRITGDPNGGRLDGSGGAGMTPKLHHPGRSWLVTGWISGCVRLARFL